MNMKRFLLLTLALTLVLVFAACGSSTPTKTAKEILALYKDYPPLDPELNRIGLEIEIGKGLMQDENGLSIQCLNFGINHSEENTKATASRLALFDAEDLSKSMNQYIGTVWTTKNSVSAGSGSYHSVTVAMKRSAAEYALLRFEGISKEEWEEAETPPMFYLFHWNAEKPELIGGPYAAEGLSPEAMSTEPTV